MMDPTDLARWTRFALKGGIGKCVALDDCVAEDADDLMFLKDDEITVLLQVSGSGDQDGVYLGYCEGVIGKFTSKHVRFLTKLKKPVMAKRSSVASMRSSHSSHSPHPHSNASSPYLYPGAGSITAKSPTPPGTSSGTGMKSSTPTFDLASIRTDSRSSSVSRFNKTPLESPVNANFSFNVPQNHHQQPSSSFNPPPSGLREEQREAEREEEREGHGHWNWRNAGGDQPPIDSSSSSSSHDLPALSTSSSTTFTSPTSSNSHHGLSAPELVYNPYRASTIQRQIELVQQETEELHHAFLHSRSASLASNFSSASSLSKRIVVPPAFELDLQEEDENERAYDDEAWAGNREAGSRDSQTLPTTPLQIVKKSPSLRLNSPASVGRSVSFGSAVGTVREDVDEDELERQLDSFGRSSLSDHGGDDESVYDDDEQEPDLEREEEDTTFRVTDDDDDDHPHPQVPSSPSPPPSPPPTHHIRHPTLDLTQTLHPSHEIEAPSHSASSSAPPDSSFSASFGQRLSMQSNGSDGEVGIGLSLLANLASGDDDSDEESNYGEDSEAEGGKRGSGEVEEEEEEEETEEGLQYGDERPSLEPPPKASVDERPVGPPSEKGRLEVQEKTEDPIDTPSTLDFPMPPTTYAANLISTAHGPGSVRSSGGSFSVASPRQQRISLSSTQQGFGVVGSPTIQQQQGPVVSRTQSSQSLMSVAFPKTGTPTSPTFPGGMGQGGQGGRSPTSPSFSVASFGAASGSRLRNVSNASVLEFAPPIFPTRERAPSVATTGTVNSSGTWEGASDIYDNYRYSRFSMGGSSVRSAKTSLRGSIIGANSVFNEEVPPPVPERRDSLGAMRGGYGGDQGGDERDEGAGREGQGRRKRADSDASVYTQGSVDEIANAGRGREEKRSVRAPSVRESIMSSSVYESARSSTVLDFASPTSTIFGEAPSRSDRRPAPLEFNGQGGGGSATSPLLHATWGSPMSSHFLDAGGGDGRDGDTDTGGMASAMRRRVEGERSPIAPTFASVVKQGLGVVEDGDGKQGLRRSMSGDGIVVEDDEQAPSRVVSGVSVDDEGTVDGHEEDDEIPTITIPPTSPAAPPLPPPSEDKPSPPTSSSNLEQYASHLRPNLRDFREGGTVVVPGTNERRSLFMPHPNAPKPLNGPMGSVGQGPMYVQRQLQTPPQSPYPPAGPYPGPHGPYPPHPSSFQPGQIFSHQPPPRPRLHVIQVIHHALSLPPPAPRPMINGRAPPPPKGPTIYGRLEQDFATALGPVPVLWSVDAPPTKVIKTVMPSQMQAPMSPPGGMSPGPIGHSPLAAGSSPLAVASSPLAGPVQLPDRTSSRSSSASLGRMSSASANHSVMSLREGMGVARSTSPKGVGPSGLGAASLDAVGDASKPIPRANFFPKAAGARPRSRSFSDLKSVGKVDAIGLRSSLSGGEIKKSPSLTGSSLSSTSTTPSLTPPTAKPVKSSPLRPSPLSLSQTALSNASSLKPKVSSPTLTVTNPSSQSMGVPTRSGSSDSGVIPPSPSSSSMKSGISRPIPVSRSTLPVTRVNSLSPPPSSFLEVGSTSSLGVAGAGTSPTSVHSMPVRVGSVDEKEREGVLGETRSLLVSSPPPMSGPSPNAAPNGVRRSSSLKAKLSLPNLRRNRSKQDEPPMSPVESVHPEMLLQVQDMEFELVRPNFNQFGAARSSEDSAVLGRDGLAPIDTNLATSSPMTPNSFLRPESPTMSISSIARSPTVDTQSSWSQSGPSSNLAGSPIVPPSPRSLLSPESESQMEAHRNRELKWMNLLSTSPPSQARKSKKTRKLLLEGVPSSVRYLVWSHLTDGKARCVPGVYPQLCKRGKVPASDALEKDVERGEWFGREEQAQLRALGEAGGGLVQLLQAYLNMVPDIQYTPGLPHIVGQLLLLAPEEDAFWIFISIMDTHIRPYFSSGSIQMEVDSALFSRALEVNDAAVAKKLLVDMGINPTAICAPWFKSLFVGCLPPEYLTRTWDMFLYDGIPFLMRVGLSIISFVRRQLLECRSEEAALSLLHRPPPHVLPPTPENYLSFVYSVKLKDDDLKKQRVKMEAQLKRQTQQQPRPGNTAGSISLPRV